MKIPADNRWTQTNEGDIFGVLNQTRNITIDQAGKLQLTKRAFSHFTSNTDVDFKDVLAILYYNNNYIIVTDDEAFEYNGAANTFVQISGTPGLDSDGDALVFNDLVYVMGATQLSHWNGSSWTTNVLASALTNGNEHPMAIFDSNPTYKLAIADGNQVYTYDTSHNINSTVLTIPSQFEISTMAYRNGYLYIGTKNVNGGEARVFIWNGDGANAQYEVPMGGEWVFSMTAYGSTVACIVDTGELALINGSSKQHLAALPVFYDPNKRWAGNNRRVAHRGMLSVRDSIYINIDGDTVGDAVLGMRSGLWSYNPASGLSHTSAFSTDEIVFDNALALSDSTLTTTTTHNLITGDSVMFDTVSGLTGVDNAVVYYVSVVSDTEIKLALSRRSLENGDFVTIGGTPGAADELIYTPNTDFGEEEITRAGAVGRVVSQDPLRTNQSTDVFFAGRLEDNVGASTYTLCGLTDSYNIGSFTTQRIYSDNISQVWKEIYAFIDGVDSSVEEVVIKHRTEREQSKPTMTISGNWGSSNTIHSDTTRFDEDDWDILDVGDEVFIMGGYGQGRTAHITNISVSSNTYVVTVDETFGNTGAAVRFVADNWKKVGVVTKNRKERDYTKQAITPASKGTWVQVKIELRGFETKVSHLELTNSVDKSAV